MWEGSTEATVHSGKDTPAENVQSDKPCAWESWERPGALRWSPLCSKGLTALREEERANSHQESKQQQAQEALYSNGKENSNSVPWCQLCRPRGVYEGAGRANGPQQLACSSSAPHRAPAETAGWGRLGKELGV